MTPTDPITADRGLDMIERATAEPQVSIPVTVLHQITERLRQAASYAAQKNDWQTEFHLRDTVRICERWGGGK